MIKCSDSKIIDSMQKVRSFDICKEQLALRQSKPVPHLRNFSVSIGYMLVQQTARHEQRDLIASQQRWTAEPEREFYPRISTPDVGQTIV